MVIMPRWPLLRCRAFRDSIQTRGAAIVQALERDAVPADESAAYALIAIGCELLDRDGKSREQLLEACANVVSVPLRRTAEADTRGT